MVHLEWLGPNKIRYYLGINSYGMIFEEIYSITKNNKPIFVKVIYTHSKYSTKRELMRSVYTMEEFSELISSINTMLLISKNDEASRKARILSFIASIKGLLEALENEVIK